MNFKTNNINNITTYHHLLKFQVAIIKFSLKILEIS
jgi:hypothetical protein